MTRKFSNFTFLMACTLAGALLAWTIATGFQSTAQAQGQPQVQQAQAAQAQPQAAQAPKAQAPKGAAAFPGGRGGPAPAPKKHVLVIGMTRGYHHGSTSDGLAMFWNLGKESGAYDTEIKTDMEWVTKRQPGSEAHSLPFFDAVIFVNCTGDWGLNDEQKEALLSFVRDDGKGLVLAHASIDANYNWPEFGEMAGGWFNAHPWNTFDAPVIVEDRDFPAMRHFPKYLRLYDEMYSAKAFSRDKVNVLMRLDESKLDYSNPQVAKRAREDKDEAIAWAKMYGKGRVFYSSLGHTKEAWDDPVVRTMYLEGIKWAMGRTEGSTASHPKVQ